MKSATEKSLSLLKFLVVVSVVIAIFMNNYYLEFSTAGKALLTISFIIIAIIIWKILFYKRRSSST
ncbi:hypothetical protein [Jeotgalibacillus campisalis]|uniref:Uncharacterized protein n=1 Tax=Jeotgalibacillus campisalis TaxID=220754 RepID=A0A0C2VXG4_9BACL|nr:hypothetical protein [Jeotgalibacillus campisalis]KIL48663.1 hypothetical protein KR50_12480 [Jeotgalibacillus campisalis]